MDEHRAEFSEEELKGAIGSREADAQRILEDESKVKQLLGKAKKLIGKIKNVPVIGALVDDLLTLFDLIGDYTKGNYKQIPVNVIVSAVAGVVYLVSPIDIIPDFIPIVGWLDDAAVITLILNTGLTLELGNYKKWKHKVSKDRFVSELLSKLIDIIGEKRLCAMFLTDDNDLKLLLTDNTEEYDVPLEVYPKIVNFDYSELKMLCEELNIDIIDVLEEVRCKLIPDCDNTVKACRESDFANFDEIFEIMVEED